MSDRLTIMTLNRLEAASLADLVTQFAELVGSTTTDETGTAQTPPDSAHAQQDPALARLTPSAYPDDVDADAEFRRMTSRDALDRRASDARAILRSLADVAVGQDSDPGVDDVVDVALDEATGWAWMRTLTALRLVIASRLGLDTEDDGDRDPDDPRFAVYDWLGYRLEGLVTELSPPD